MKCFKVYHYLASFQAPIRVKDETLKQNDFFYIHYLLFDRLIEVSVLPGFSGDTPKALILALKKLIICDSLEECYPLDKWPVTLAYSLSLLRMDFPSQPMSLKVQTLCGPKFEALSDTAKQYKIKINPQNYNEKLLRLNKIFDSKLDFSKTKIILDANQIAKKVLKTEQDEPTTIT